MRLWKCFILSTSLRFLFLSRQTPNGDIMKHKSSRFERHTSSTSSNFLAFYVLPRVFLTFAARVLKLIGKLSPRCFDVIFLVRIETHRTKECWKQTAQLDHESFSSTDEILMLRENIIETRCINYEFAGNFFP